MTPAQSRLILEHIAGYEIQVSPAGKYLWITDEGPRPMPDLSTDLAEAESCLAAWCRVNKARYRIVCVPSAQIPYRVKVVRSRSRGQNYSYGPTIPSTIASLLCEILGI